MSDLGDPWAGSIHNLHASLIEQLHFAHAGAKCRQDNHISGLDATKVFALVARLNDLDVHLL